MKSTYISALILAFCLLLIIGFSALLLTGNFFYYYLAPIFALLAALVHIGTMFLLDLISPEKEHGSSK